MCDLAHIPAFDRPDSKEISSVRLTLGPETGLDSSIVDRPSLLFPNQILDLSLGRNFVPGSRFEQPSISLFEHAAPLFKEECDASRGALVSDVSHPTFFNWPCSRSRFAAHDNPINVR
jgi:hypothetical protein